MRRLLDAGLRARLRRLHRRKRSSHSRANIALSVWRWDHRALSQKAGARMMAGESRLPSGDLLAKVRRQQRRIRRTARQEQR